MLQALASAPLAGNVTQEDTGNHSIHGHGASDPKLYGKMRFVDASFKEDATEIYLSCAFLLANGSNTLITTVAGTSYPSKIVLTAKKRTAAASGDEYLIKHGCQPFTFID
jgi:hypothetical protein